MVQNGRDDGDQESQDFWHFLTLMDFKTFYLPALWSAFGEDAQKGAERTTEVMGPVMAVLTVCLIVGFVIWAVGHYLFLAW